MSAEIKEIEIEEYLVRQVYRHGGTIRKVRWVGRRDAPDRLVMLPRVGHVLVELKKPGEVPRIGQLNEHKVLRKFGFRVEVIDSFAQVNALVLESLAP